MNIHILPGDSLVETFKESEIEGEIVVCRESFIEGNIEATNLQEFWEKRADFIKFTHGESKERYFDGVVSEFEKLNNLASDAVINLWFEYELFCQVNMWFCLYLLKDSKATIYRIFPILQTGANIWKGFGKLNSQELLNCYKNKVKFSQEDIQLGVKLWEACQKANYETLMKLSENESACFPYLKEVCKAETEKSFRPKEILKEITLNGMTDFSEIFNEFSRLAGVYGFGDSQVKRIMQEI